MRKVTVRRATKLSSKKIWSLIINLNNYPNHVKFLKKIEFEKPLSMGSSFSDITTIAYIPIKIAHEVDIYEENKRIGFFVKMPLFGFMKQRVEIEDKGLERIVNLTVEFDFQNKLLDIIFGKFLEKRVKEMLLYILDSENS